MGIGAAGAPATGSCRVSPAWLVTRERFRSLGRGDLCHGCRPCGPADTAAGLRAGWGGGGRPRHVFMLQCRPRSPLRKGPRRRSPRQQCGRCATRGRAHPKLPLL